MQIRLVDPIIDKLASMLHTVWQSWLASVLEHGGVPPESRIIIPASIVGRWRKLSSISYESLTRLEKDPYIHLAEVMEMALSTDYIIIPKADYDAKIQVEVLAKIGNIHGELIDCLVFARGEALGRNEAMVMKSSRCLAYFSLVTNPNRKVAAGTPNKKEAI